MGTLITCYHTIRCTTPCLWNMQNLRPCKEKKYTRNQKINVYSRRVSFSAQDECVLCVCVCIVYMCVCVCCCVCCVSVCEKPTYMDTDTALHGYGH